MNIKTFFKFSVCCFLCITYEVFASDSIREEMLDHLSFIKKTFEIKYAPSEWKRESFGWDLNDNCEKAQKKILNLSSPTLKEYHKILREVFLSAADYHVNIYFHSTEAAFLPFKVRGTKGRYFISWVDSERLNIPEWSVGDEILSFDGRPIHELIEEIRLSDWDRHNEMTDRRLAEGSLTARVGIFSQEVPQGEVALVIKHKGAVEGKTYNLTWDYRPELIKEVKMEEPKPKGLTPLFQRPFFNKEMITPYYSLFKKVDKLYSSEEDRQELGARESFVPPLGRIIWESSEESPFHAYICETPSRLRIGYIRIAEYLGGEEEVEEFAKLLEDFQNKTQALILDQVNNPGGSVFYKYALLSMLTNKILQLPTYRVTLTQDDVMEALETIEVLEVVENDADAIEICGETLGGYPMSYDLVQSISDYCKFVLSEWESGKYFTDPVYLLFNKIEPSKLVNYTKPIIVLTNELDFSCADSFPAILQDNHQAVIFGTKTAGAGGAVQGTSYPNLLGIAGYSYTMALLERQNKRPIENVGVEPDVVYSLTPEDYQNGYQRYRSALMKVVEEAVQKARPIRR